MQKNAASVLGVGELRWQRQREINVVTIQYIIAWVKRLKKA